MTGDKADIDLGGTVRSPEDAKELCELGLRFGELSMVHPEKFLRHLKMYRSFQDTYGIYYVCHGPREGDPNDTQALESVYLPRLFHILSLMPRLEMRLLTVHLWMDPRFLSDKTIEFKIKFLDKLLEKADEFGVTVCLENLSENADHLAGVFESLPGLNLTLDLGHAQLLSEKNTSFGFMERFPDRIKHLHIHDNRGGNSPADDLHLPVGDGVIDFKRIFRKLKAIGYHGTMTLELRPREIKKCMNYVRELL
ncbi:MAG: sugar phosphate isomerase/epimerase [Deltaproteobacteria bacterium]|nr:sugar phosphate isomerase/epimerase [Deltaproteobacteria bacterium]